MLGRCATGGTGTGGGLGNQGALAFSKNGDYLFAVNPGSNNLSVFSVGKNGKLKLIMPMNYSQFFKTSSLRSMR